MWLHFFKTSRIIKCRHFKTQLHCIQLLRSKLRTVSIQTQNQTQVQNQGVHNVHCRFKIYRRFHFSHSWLRFFLLNYSWQWMDRPTPFRISPKCLLLNLSFVCSENWPTFLEFGSNAQTLGKSWHLRIVKKEIIFCGEFCKKWWLKTIAK